MIKPFSQSHLLIKLINNFLIDLPAPSSLSYWWNFGSLLGLCFIVTGLFLSTHYSADVMSSFNSLSHICRDVNYGWLLWTIYANGVSLFFVCVYLHVGHGL